MTEQDSRQVVVVTGASAGIGKATTIALAAKGWHVIGVGRDPERSALAEAEISAAAAADGRVDFLRGDFTLMSEVKRVADEIKSRTNRLDVLINNAGGVRDRLHLTTEGVEATFAANHLAPFLLTRELMPLLKAAAAASPTGAARVLAVSSSGHAFCPGMHWDDLNLIDNFTTGGAYCQAKLANILFTRALNARMEPEGIVAQSMHPGVVASNFASHADRDMKNYLQSLEGNPPEHAARTLVWMATAAEAGARGGRYFHELAEVVPAPQALDGAAAERLWEESEKLLARLGYV